MFDALYSAVGALMIASLLLLVALWVQIRRDLKTSYFRGFASALASVAQRPGGSAMVQTIMQQRAIQLTDLDRRGVAKQDLLALRQCVDSSAQAASG
jgi:hypothetical protein